MKIIAEETITNVEAKEILEKRAKEIELKYEQKNALEILRKFTKLDVEKVKKLVEELKKIEKLREKQIVEIVNFLPEDKDELRVVLHKEYNSFTPEEIDKILETVKKYV
ncbi:MAG: RNA polymerase Rpb4 family protein [Candidatus Aenigmarchaeota archaeon]|nr:RNA polymerase Rpb4 family protein [Candidatus Aenigmarchaeota archaeon]